MKIFRCYCGILAFCTIIVGCSELKTESMYKNISIKGQEYRIPSEYILTDLPSAMVPQGSAMDDDEGINLVIPLADIGVSPLSHVSSTGNAGIVRVLLYGLSPFIATNEYALNPDAYNAWMRLGNYHQNRVIEKDEKTGLYRIYWRQGAISWQYFKEPPSNTKNSMSPKWVAGCRIRGSEPEADDMSNVDCRVQLSSEWGNADISFSGSYVTGVDDILNGVRNKIKEWVITD